MIAVGGGGLGLFAYLLVEPRRYMLLYIPIWILPLVRGSENVENVKKLEF